MGVLARWTDLLDDALPGEHLVQLFRREEFLAEAVTVFAGAGLKRGDAVILVATPVHVEAFCRELAAAGHDVEQARRWGQLFVVDAATLLSRLTTGAGLDGAAFAAIVGELVERARAGSSRRDVRVFGEMVDLLWKRDLAAAVQLEQLWNELIESQPVSLLCSYHLADGDTETAFPPPLCRAHTRLVPES